MASTSEARKRREAQAAPDVGEARRLIGQVLDADGVAAFFGDDRILAANDAIDSRALLEAAYVALGGQL